MLLANALRLVSWKPLQLILQRMVEAWHRTRGLWISERAHLLMLVAITLRQGGWKQGFAGKRLPCSSAAASLVSSASRAAAGVTSATICTAIAPRRVVLPRRARAALAGLRWLAPLRARARALRTVVRKALARGVARQLLAGVVVTSTLWEGRRAYQARCRRHSSGIMDKEAIRHFASTLVKLRKTGGIACELDEASRVLAWLFIGGAEAAATHEVLEEHGIKHVLNCCERIPFASENTRNQKLCMRDVPTERLASHLPVAFAFLEEAKAAGGKCLVHCRMGASRSVAVVLSYLIVREGMRLSDAWALVHSCRKVARPNRGFVEQLVDLDRVVHGPSLMAPPQDLTRSGSRAPRLRKPRRKPSTWRLGSLTQGIVSKSPPAPQLTHPF
mmetsp:Transcript_91867/g.230879  ORF Transcript_91867/g.230879 Transcript_91867/m.230879 type:complete len:388 (-) Transcript_91867:92-1255(-)